MVHDPVKENYFMIEIRLYHDKDWRQLWPIIEKVFRSGETYAFSPDISETEAHNVWIKAPTATYVALIENQELAGTYYLKPNQPGLGSHVCNCGYIVSEKAQGKGIAAALCEHSQKTARTLGFKAMQFNLVVSTNEGAIRLWKKLGFETIGVLPKAFNHRCLGLVDALIMYKWIRKACLT
jgi:RimJ/RimL family protein N-acetyltransferase